jgi:hypothetical protein
VHGEELYDLGPDPGQQRNVASGRKDIVSRMRSHYETRWDGVQSAFKRGAPAIVGSPRENPVELNSADWRGFDCNDISCVAKAEGGPRGRPWGLLTERSGEYEITVARWPLAEGLALNAARPAQRMRVGSVPGGRAVAVSSVHIRVDGKMQSVKTGPSDSSARFRVRLPARREMTLEAWFGDAAGADLCGAYYARIEYLGGGG